MAEHERQHPGANPVLVIAGLVVVLAGIRTASVVAVPAIVAVLVTVIAAPLERRLVRRGTHRLVAYVLVLAGTIVALIAAVALLEAAITAFINDIPGYEPGIERILNGVLGLGSAVGLDVAHVINVAQVVESALDSVDMLTKSLLTSLAEWTVVLLLVVFMLHEALEFPEKLAAVLRDPEHMRRVRTFFADLAGFMRVDTVDATATAMGDIVVLVVAGAPSALLWTGLAFLFSYVPSVGVWMTVIPPTVATFARYGVLRAVLVAVGLTAVDSAVGLLVLPRLVGRQLGIAPFWAILSIVFWTWFFGPAGAILAIPLTITAKFLLESSPATAPLATLISPVGGRTPREPRVRRRRGGLAGPGG